MPRSSILLVDDHHANLLALEAILEPLEQHLVRASSGEEALKRVLAEQFSVILMDVQMPGLDGFATAKLIKERERSRSIPIIFLTAISREPSHIFKGYAHGAVDYLLKPFDPDVLRSKVAVFVDLHARGEQIQRQAELLRERDREALERENELRFRSLMESMPMSIWVTRLDGTVAYRNGAACAFSGAHGAKLFADDDSLHPAELAGAREAWEQALAQETPCEFQARLRRVEDGAFRWHLIRAVPDRDARTQTLRWVVAATDFDASKRAEEALEKSEQELRRANAAKDDFLAAASHELRTPIQALKGHVQLMLRTLPSEQELKAARSLRTIDRQVDRISQLVTDLLDVTRIQAGRLSLRFSTFDFRELLSEVVDRVQILTQRHQLDLLSGGPLPVTLDRSRMEQVVTNLLSNAVRYSPEGGVVRLAASEEGEELHLQVTDKGVGVPREKQALIFERFGRAHGGAFGGLGLGLTISHGIVEQHGGRIWVESAGVPGRGSTFHVVLPRQPGQDSTAGSSDEE